MKKARLGALGALIAALGTFSLSSPAQAATNPYTPQEACSHEFGGSWHTASDGHRALLDSWGNTWGNIYLEYNSATGDNCVTTIKSAWVGQASDTEAELWVQDSPVFYRDEGMYKYYAAVKAHAAGKCVKYYGRMYTPDSTTTHLYNGRSTWGNCG